MSQSGFLSFLLADSLVLPTSPSGFGHRGRDHCSGPPHRPHPVLQEVQETESEAAGGERGSSPQREKRSHCVVRPRERQRERNRGSNTLSLSFSLAVWLGAFRGMWCSFLGHGALFLNWTPHFLPPLPPWFWPQLPTWTNRWAAVIKAEKNVNVSLCGKLWYVCMSMCLFSFS